MIDGASSRLVKPILRGPHRLHIRLLSDCVYHAFALGTCIICKDALDYAQDPFFFSTKAFAASMRVPCRMRTPGYCLPSADDLWLVANCYG